MQRDTIVRMLSNFQCRKISEGHLKDLKNRFAQPETSKNGFFFQNFFFRRKFHSAKKGALSSPKTFPGRKRLWKWREYPLTKYEILISKKSRRKKLLKSLLPFGSTKKSKKSLLRLGKMFCFTENLKKPKIVSKQFSAILLRFKIGCFVMRKNRPFCVVSDKKLNEK